jgi:HAD superfamily hydrolase (TIGR01509 family)
MKTRSIDAVVFDFDGTIADTETPVYEAWRTIFEDHNCELPLSVWVQCVGSQHSGFDAFDHLLTLSGGDFNRDEIEAEQQRRSQRMRQGMKPLPGVVSWLEEASSRRLPCAVASSSSRDWVETMLEGLGLSQYFQALACGDEVPRTKPDPRIYQLAAERLDVDPHKAIAVEDSANGVKAAVAAGLLCIAVPNPVTCGLDFSDADHVCGSLEEFNLGHFLGSERLST